MKAEYSTSYSSNNFTIFKQRLLKNVGNFLNYRPALPIDEDEEKGCFRTIEKIDTRVLSHSRHTNFTSKTVF